MSETIQSDMVKKAVGIGGTVLLAPIAPPVLHGLAGVAVVGLGLFAAGSLFMKVAGVFNAGDRASNLTGVKQNVE